MFHVIANMKDSTELHLCKDTADGSGATSCHTPHDGQEFSVLPHDGEEISVLPHDGEEFSVLPQDGEEVSILPRDGEEFSVLPRDEEEFSILRRDEEDAASGWRGEQAQLKVEREEVSLPKGADGREQVESVAADGDAGLGFVQNAGSVPILLGNSEEPVPQDGAGVEGSGVVPWEGDANPQKSVAPAHVIGKSSSSVSKAHVEILAACGLLSQRTTQSAECVEPQLPYEPPPGFDPQRTHVHNMGPFLWRSAETADQGPPLRENADGKERQPSRVGTFSSSSGGLNGQGDPSRNTLDGCSSDHATAEYKSVCLMAAEKLTGAGIAETGTGLAFKPWTTPQGSKGAAVVMEQGSGERMVIPEVRYRGETKEQLWKIAALCVQALSEVSLPEIPASFEFYSLFQVLGA